MQKVLIRTLVLLILFVMPAAAVAQRTVTIMGKITDKETNAILPNAAVKFQGTSVGTAANSKGRYSLTYQHSKPMKLVVSSLGYEDSDMIVDNSVIRGRDTIYLNFQLDVQVYTGPVVNINGKPDTIFGHEQLSVEDFEFHDGNYVILTYEKTLKRGSEIIYADRGEEIIARYPVPETRKAKELFVDYEGQINLICEHAVYRVDIADEKIALYPRDVKDFEFSVKPIVDTAENKLFFTDYHPDYPAFIYFNEKIEEDTVEMIRFITDNFLMELYRSEYKYLEPRDKLLARDLADKYNVEKEIAGAILSGFANSIYYDPLYAPLFNINDTITVFDHYNNLIYRYDTDNNFIDSVEITYHQEKQKKWEKLIIIDEVTHAVYAVFSKNGFTYLKQINTSTGEVVKTFKFAYKYANRIHIKNDFAYYVYRPYGSLQKKFLYRELIN